MDSILSELNDLLSKQIESVRSDRARPLNQTQVDEIGKRYFKIRDLVAQLKDFR
jgi:hypothetical protein